MSAQPVLMVVNPHPDDESIATGGLIAEAAAIGARVVVVTCTGGEHGERDPAIAPTLEDLRDVRRRELAAAAQVLGVAQLEYLGYGDSGMPGAPENEAPESFHRADLDEATSRLLALIREHRPQVLIAPDEDGLYFHPDHVKANRVAVAAFEAASSLPNPPQKLYYTTLSRSTIRRFGRLLKAAGIDSPFNEMDVEVPPIGLPDEQITLVLDVRQRLEQKMRAIVAHQSQVGQVAMFTSLPRGIQEQIFGYEDYALARSRMPVHHPESDVFAGIDGFASAGRPQ